MRKERTTLRIRRCSQLAPFVLGPFAEAEFNSNQASYNGDSGSLESPKTSARSIDFGMPSLGKASSVASVVYTN